MSHKVNLVRVLTAATGNSTPITLGSKYSNLFMTPAEAGAMDGRTYTYNIVDGNDFEIGRGVYTASGTSLARTTVLVSRIAGTLGTSRITLSGTAQVRFIDAADDMDGIRGTRAVTGTTDAIMNSDLGYAVTYSNASAVAVSLAQAGAALQFLDGWACYVKNKGAGAVTITPATSTIDGAATLVLAQNQGAFIWSDGTNYQVIRFGLATGTTVGTVAAGDDARIVASVKKIVVQKFTTSGTYTPTSGMTYCVIECVGGGGGGGGAAVSGAGVQNGSGGGGGGSYSRKLALATDIGVLKTVTVGAGGAAGSYGNNPGGAGGTTSVGTLCVANGGTGGLGAASGANGTGGLGGSVGTGDFTIPGGAGGSGGLATSSSVFPIITGLGGHSFYGQGAPGQTASNDGVAGTGYGAGGGGASDFNAGNRPGGAGTEGVVIITEYLNA